MVVEIGKRRHARASRARGWLRTVTSLSAIAGLLSAEIAVAQVNLPMGSPVGQGSNRQQNQNGGEESLDSSRQPAAKPYVDPTGNVEQLSPVEISDGGQANLLPQEADSNIAKKKPIEPSEFERYVEAALGRKLNRFGADLVTTDGRDFALPATATVPPEYILNVGDVVTISLTGSTQGSVEKQIDTDGRIFLPRVGSIMLAGVRYADLRAKVIQAVGLEYRGFDVTVGIRQLRGIRVYVTGFANSPGAYSVNSLSTMVNAVLAAGGPSGGGSFRSLKLYRRGNLVSDFDLYELIRRGNRSGDLVLQNEDVLYVEPLGKQVAITGSVNEEAIYEAKAGETIEQLLKFAGGPNDLADDSRVMLYRSSDPDSSGAQQIGAAQLQTEAVKGGDLLQILSKGTLQRPLAGQSVLVRIEGEVDKPGNYYVPSNSTLQDIMNQAGGTTDRAFVYGTRLERYSVKEQQRVSFTEAINQLEMSLAAAPLTSGQTLDAGERAGQLAGARAVLDQLRKAEPDGRVVLDIEPTARTVPGDMLLENNDRIVIPPRATTIGVFGAVYRPASFYLDPAKTPMRVEEYLQRAGGAMRSADRGSIFVVRANGSVISRKNGALKVRVLPGDVIFVPVKTQSTSIWARIREISTMVFQLGITAAAIAAIK